jgi:TRAP-type C4-dicarboxylate transport system permease small subunit
MKSNDMKTIIGIIDKIDRTIKNLLNFLLVFLVVDVSWQVITRFLLPEPSSYTEEIARFLLIWIGLLGAAHAYRKKMHLGIDYFSQKLAFNQQKILSLTVYFLCALFALSIFIIGGASLAQLTLELNQTSPALGIKMGYVYLVLPLSGSLILLYTFELVIACLQQTAEEHHNTQQDFLN